MFVHITVSKELRVSNPSLVKGLAQKLSEGVWNVFICCPLADELHEGELRAQAPPSSSSSSSAPVVEVPPISREDELPKVEVQHPPIAPQQDVVPTKRDQGENADLFSSTSTSS